MEIEINNIEKTEKKVVTVEFKGSIDFSIDEEGNVVDGNKTITHQELYEMFNPAVEELATETENNNEWENDLNTPVVY